MPQHITVVNYDPEWPSKYVRERDYITEILKENCISIYHIGSTSVPGLAAKPIIDIMAVVRSLEKVDTVAEKFSEIGYEYLGEFGITGRRYLRKGGDERTHQIHIFQADDWNNIGRHLAFRDYMHTHEKERNEYAKIKKDLAQKFPYDIDGYCDGKENFVREMEERALAQYDGTWDKLYIAARKVQHERKLSPLIEVGSVSAAVLSAKDWTQQTVPEVLHYGFDYSENSRGLGPSEMAEAIAEGRPNRASAKMAYHVLDTIDQIMKSAETGAFEKVPSTCERPEAMPNS